MRPRCIVRLLAIFIHIIVWDPGLCHHDQTLQVMTILGALSGLPDVTKGFSCQHLHSEAASCYVLVVDECVASRRRRRP